MQLTGANHAAVPGDDPGRRAVTHGWISLLLIPVAFMLAFVVGDGMSNLVDSPAAGDPQPGWVMWVASVPAIVIFLVPCAAAVLYGQRARRAGWRSGLVPLVVGGVLGLGWLGLNVAAPFQ